jgi:hypothetical protein
VPKVLELGRGERRVVEEGEGGELELDGTESIWWVWSCGS